MQKVIKTPWGRQNDTTSLGDSTWTASIIVRSKGFGRGGPYYCRETVQKSGVCVCVWACEISMDVEEVTWFPAKEKNARI